MKTQLIEKTFRLITALCESGDPMTLKDLCAKTGVTPPAASRILSDLTSDGYVRKVSYRTFEPGIGLLYLGQAPLRDNFFPRKAILLLHQTLREWKIGGAIAGLFREHLVYLYHSSQEHGELHALPMHSALCNSNIALVAGCTQSGEEHTRAILQESLHHTNFPEKIRQQKQISIDRRIRFFRKNGYSLWDDEPDNWNLCFPIRTRNQVYGLSFFCNRKPGRSSADLFLACSRLTVHLRTMLQNPDGAE